MSCLSNTQEETTSAFKFSEKTEGNNTTDQKRLSVVWDNADDKHLMSRKEGNVGNVLAITTHMYLNDSGLNDGYPHKDNNIHYGTSSTTQAKLNN